MQEALKEVKERNQSLCTIMSQGECKLIIINDLCFTISFVVLYDSF